MSEFISSNIWTILASAWIVGFGLFLLARKRPSKEKVAEWAAALVALLIAFSVMALGMAAIFGVFLYLPGLLFGSAGTGAGMVVLFGSMFYMIEHEDSHSHKKAFKFTFTIMSIGVPLLFLMSKVG